MTINPRALKLGIEANVVQTVSRALIEEVTFSRSNVTALDWEGYPIIRFTEAPTVNVISIERPDLRATGSGEPSCNPIAPAIGNAVFDAVGVRPPQPADEARTGQSRPLKEWSCARRACLCRL